MNTLERLKAKLNSKGKMPSIMQISELLTKRNIKHSVTSETNTVETRSDGNRYVNDRHQGKTGLCLKIKESGLTLNTSDSYYSLNSRGYARELLELIGENK
jgi:hypothetical protein